MFLWGFLVMLIILCKIRLHNSNIVHIQCPGVCAWILFGMISALTWGLDHQNFQFCNTRHKVHSHGTQAYDSKCIREGILNFYHEINLQKGKIDDHG